MVPTTSDGLEDIWRMVASGAIVYLWWSYQRNETRRDTLHKVNEDHIDKNYSELDIRIDEQDKLRQGLEMTMYRDFLSKDDFKEGVAHLSLGQAELMKGMKELTDTVNKVLIQMANKKDRDDK